ncbi:TPA: hypothetical protein DEB00_01385 [Candidatus Uhrbacteria bacterium]|nr:hypothetical protein [Candidatus Uhrbacteria bacterium]
MHSLDFSKEALEIKDRLEERGHVVSLCYSVSRIQRGDLSVKEVVDLKAEGNFSDYTIAHDLIRWNWERLQKDEAILVINITKKGIENFIGGNTFLEMGFAHVLHKRIFLWNAIPDMLYTDEIMAMQPTVIYGNVDLIQ